MRKKVLIADDTTLMREMMRGALPAEDYQIVGEAISGDKAIEMYKETQPDVMLLDINMPKMNGIDALTEIMKIDPNAKVIMCSDQKYESMIMMALKKGAKDFVIKPFTSYDILLAVKKLFNED
ncbi:response regulator [Butyrivibrio sp. AE2032]|jgi:two-component system chemotaxis response regulator CheY|uniref:response regulator n=1 Tax=Butyrivibrio sp. AE2032 TaxID=1458463 RepID=UPI000550B474|nr:response regulator [Butyrivibrio sp. AE2032]